jgi:8-oxo-dGTP diphosphatase
MISIEEDNLIQQLSIDCVIFGYEDKRLKVLIPKFKCNFPMYSLPGGFIFQDESIDNAAKRILKERTEIKDIYLEQFCVFGKENRVNEMVLTKSNELKLSKEHFEWLNKRFVSIGYYALVDIKKVTPKISELDENIQWYNVKEVPKLIIDHNEIISKAQETLRQNIDNKLIAFNLLPESFTMREVQELYEAIYDKPFARNNFQKKMLDLDVLERLEKKFTGAANKAPYLYRFKR